MAADRTRDSRPSWLPLAAAAIVVPTVLAGLTLLWPRPQIEGELSRTAGEALTAAGFTDAGLVVDGRDVTISGVPDGDRTRAIDTVQAATGVRVARFPDAGSGSGGGGTGAGTGAGAVQAQPFGIARRGDDLVLTGIVGSEQERSTLVAAATAQAGGRAVIDELAVTPGAPLPAGVDAASVGAAAAAVAAGGDDLAVSISEAGALLTGTVPDEAARTAAETSFATALPGTAVDNRLTIDPSAGTGATTPGAAAGELDDAAKQELQGRIDQLVAGAPITFGPDSPQLTAQGMATVARVLELLGPAAGARLQVDGFVATGPGNGRLTAQQLSDQRASTVRDALVTGGVPADRILARGLGEAAATAADRAAGRRAEITVV